MQLQFSYGQYERRASDEVAFAYKNPAYKNYDIRYGREYHMNTDYFNAPIWVPEIRRPVGVFPDSEHVYRNNRHKVRPEQNYTGVVSSYNFKVEQNYTGTVVSSYDFEIKDNIYGFEITKGLNDTRNISDIFAYRFHDMQILDTSIFAYRFQNMRILDTSIFAHKYQDMRIRNSGAWFKRDTTTRLYYKTLWARKSFIVNVAIQGFEKPAYVYRYAQLNQMLGANIFKEAIANKDAWGIVYKSAFYDKNFALKDSPYPLPAILNKSKALALIVYPYHALLNKQILMALLHYPYYVHKFKNNLIAPAVYPYRVHKFKNDLAAPDPRIVHKFKIKALAPRPYKVHKFKNNLIAPIQYPYTANIFKHADGLKNTAYPWRVHKFNEQSLQMVHYPYTVNVFDIKALKNIHYPYTANVFKYVGMKLKDKKLIFNKSVDAIKYKHNGAIDYKNHSFTKNKKSFSDFNEYVPFIKASKSLRIQHEKPFAVKSGKPFMVRYENPFITKNAKPSRMIAYKSQWFTKNYRRSVIDYKHEWITKIKKHGRFIAGYMPFSKIGKHIRLYDVLLRPIKHHKDIRIINQPFLTHRVKKSFKINEQPIWFMKRHKDMRIFQRLFRASKHHKDMRIYPEFFATKDKKDMLIYPFMVGATKDRKSMLLYDIQLAVHKPGLSAVYIEPPSWFTKYPINAAWLNNAYWFDRIPKHIMVGEMSRGIKSHIPLAYLPLIENEFDGLSIPINKSSRPVFIDRINEWGLKNIKSSDYIQEGTFGSKLPRDIRYILGFEPWCDKIPKDVFIDRYNEWVVKKEIYATLTQKNIFGTKVSKNVFIDRYNEWVTKKHRNVFIDRYDEWFTKRHRNVIIPAALGKIVPGIKKTKKVFIDKYDEFCKKVPRTTWYPHHAPWAYKKYILAYYAYHDLITHKILKDVFVSNMLSSDAVQKRLFVQNMLMPDKKLEGWYDYYTINLHKYQYDSGINKPIFARDPRLKEADYMPKNDTWAWVYEDPDPFYGEWFGLDELLLPENDTRYDRFEDLIFDKENLVPRNPVKILNDTTFIAAMPTEMPVPDRSKEGIVYLDVRSGLMHDVFLNYYRIWQHNIYKFATMDMVKAANLMLDYLWDWIQVYFPPGNSDEDRNYREVVRVFRQIRWYTECAIINNSQFLVSYEMETLKPDLSTGICEIPNSVTTNDPAKYPEVNHDDSFILDPTNGIACFKPNPAKLHQPAKLEFYIHNQNDSEIKFMLSSMHGKIEILINDVLEDELYSPVSAGVFVYPLPKTTGYNKVTIQKDALNNASQQFYVGWLEVPKLKFSHLRIEYDPQLRNGNRPLDEVARKLIAFANLHGQDYYDTIRKSNLGINEAYRIMKQYWNLHHQDKIKGKRLTIKET